jgi:hypothetical protein
VPAVQRKIQNADKNSCNGQNGCRDIRIDKSVKVMQRKSSLVRLNACLGLKPVLEQSQRAGPWQQFRTHIGLCSNLVCTKALSPMKPRRISVTPAAIQMRVLAGSVIIGTDTATPHVAPTDQGCLRCALVRSDGYLVKLFQFCPSSSTRLNYCRSLTRGYDPDDFDFERIDGIVYLRGRGGKCE